MKYLWYVLRHRWFVMFECWKRGLIWRGLVHDLSKFRPSEFFPYARHFAAGIQAGRDKTGYYKPTDTGDPAFDYAWFLHQKRNSHHWQYWVFPIEKKGVKVLPIPFPDLLEMICDWYGASRAQKVTGSVKEWYAVNGYKMRLHADTRKLIEKEMK